MTEAGRSNPANRIRDLDRRGVDWKIMHEINFVNLDYRPFDASAWPDTLSGLLGPVTLTPLRILDLKQMATPPEDGAAIKE